MKRLPLSAMILLAVMLPWGESVCQPIVPWVYRPERDIKFPLPDSLVFPYLCATDRLGNLWVISTSASLTSARNALFKAAPGDTMFSLVVDYTTDLNVESTRGVATLGDTVLVVSRMPGTPVPQTAIVYEYVDGDPTRRNDYSGSGYGTWVTGLSANKDKFVYAGVRFLTSIRVYNFTGGPIEAVAHGRWMPILPIENHPSEPGGHFGAELFSFIRDCAVIPGADYSKPETPFYTSRESDTTGAKGGVAVWTGGTQMSPIGYRGQRVTDVASDLAWLWWTPYGLGADSLGNLYACGTDTARRWVKVFTIVGNFAVEVEELPSSTSKSVPVPEGAPFEAPSDVALSPDEQTAYVIDQEARRAFVFTRGTTAVKQGPSATLPRAYRLHANHPNPFNAATEISYEIPHAGPVELKVYDLLGREVSALVHGWQAAGIYRVPFEAKDLPSGIYFYQLRAEGFVDTRKMTYLK